MFNIKYEIISEQFNDVSNITEEEIQYNFLLGNLLLLTPNAEIEMEWEWIPLLDFAYCLKRIVSNLKINDTAKEYFEFTENAETLEFSRQREQLKIVASFSSSMVETTFADFEKAVYDFNISISEHIRRNISNELPSVLQKYLSVKV